MNLDRFQPPSVPLPPREVDPDEWDDEPEKPMSNNAYEPAFPIPPDIIGPNGEISRPSYFGLTKRELFAAMAMQALRAQEGWGPEPFEQIAHTAVAQAEALLAELAKETKPSTK